MAPVRRLVLDVLKPHDPPLVEFTERVADLDAVEGATSSLVELDREVQNAKLTVEGSALDLPTLEDRVESLGGTVHSVDQVSCGDRVVEDRETPQD
ncbi:DUF211 domain-containing protein [Halogeometricum luteum]|uniref:DUF211 domain-containing protein n=1 Tax=Halogeometricum luteum TaxID=2950537 RepID=A0ABU2FWV6_9EURY|nr:DUF211 domain-containing protein [Halogeometricum sp. S3BR5-2]MDS0293026.1 DUF211 domain-containing protein [Halogeometricum sp. S3BR5-2]